LIVLDFKIGFVCIVKIMNCPVCANVAIACAETHPDCVLYRCTACSHKFSQLKPGLMIEPYDAKYFEETHRNWFANPDEHLYGKIAKVIAQERNIQDIIDVGCGNGNLLRFLSAHTPPGVGLTGVDLMKNESTSRIAYIQSDIFSVEIEKRFSAVTTLGTIEHIDNVRAFARRLKSLLRPNGLLVVMTVNDDSLLYMAARFFRRIGFSKPFDRIYSHHHLNHFTRESLSRLLENENFRIESAVLHNVPLASVDIPTTSAGAAFLQHFGVRVLFGLGWLMRRSYLQTVFCRAN